MQARLLLKLALICAILGVLSLYMICDSIAIDSSTLAALDEMEGETAVVTGIVSVVRDRNGTTFIELEKMESVDVVVFERVPGIEIGQLIQVRGKVDLYEGDAEILGEEIRVIG